MIKLRANQHAEGAKLMEAVRKGEHGLNQERKTRFYTHGRSWYFYTREGASIGPFDRLSEAVEWAEDYIEYLKHAPVLDDVLAQANPVQASPAQGQLQAI